MLSDRNLNNYLMWHLTLKFLPYLSRQFTEANEMFRKESLGSSHGVPRWEFCASETMKFFPHGSDYLLYKQTRGEVRKLRVQKVDEIFESLMRTLSSRVSEANKYDETTRNFLIDKVSFKDVI
jgi:hypothetical protein